MYKSININEFDDYMLDIFLKYGDEVIKTAMECTNRLAPKIKPELKGYSSKGGHLYRTGGYQRGWGLKNVKKKDLYQVKTYNRSKPTLAHLLEFGHRGPVPTRDGAKAYPHIRKTELKYLGILMENLESEIKKI